MNASEKPNQRGGYHPVAVVVAVVIVAFFVIVIGVALYHPSLPLTTSRKIIITYTYTTRDTIPPWSVADTGKTFIIVNMTIENQGYDEFYVNPWNFEAIVDQVAYSYSGDTYFLDYLGYTPMESTDVLDGGKLVCAIAFEIPENYQSFSLRYEWIRYYNIEWVWVST